MELTGDDPRGQPRRQQVLPVAADQYRTLIERNPAVSYIMAPHPDCSMRYVSPQIEALLGYLPADAQSDGQVWRRWLHPDDHDRVLERYQDARAHATTLKIEHRLLTHDGRTIWVHNQAALVEDQLDVGGESGWHGVLVDITEEKQRTNPAFHDTLTGLPNRALLLDRLQQALHCASRRADGVAVLCLALNDFKLINNSLGNDIGERLLVSVANRLRLILRACDTAARVEGGEFAILLDDISDVEEMTAAARRVLRAIEMPYYIDDHDLVVGASIGIASSLTRKAEAEDLLRQADTALAQAKSARNGNLVIYEPRMNARAIERLQTEQALRRALEQTEICVYYQPVVDLVDHRLVEVEALARWQRPGYGLVEPDQFIPLAEETGLIGPLGRWVLAEACSAVHRWQEEQPGAFDLRLSVNLSPHQLRSPGLADEIVQVLDDTAFSPQHLKLELTESAMLENVDGLAGTLKRLKALGIQLAMDDFGTGYASLAYLKRLPMDALKIDRSFVRSLASDQENRALVRAIITTGQALRLDVTAEGIETEEQSYLLRLLGCTLGQGYYYSEPVPAAQITALLEFQARAAAHARPHSHPYLRLL